MTQASPTSQETASLDALTGGAFSAPTSGERAARIRDWLATEPSAERIQEVFKEFNARDKGAAKPLRLKLDEIRRAKEQDAIAQDWAARAQALLDLARLNIADALAWQRDAAKAGAPLSKEPLASLKALLADRIKGVEDLQHRVQVQREAAVLLAQRIEVLSTKPWQDAVAAADALRADVPAWHAQADALAADGNWDSLDARFVPLLEASRAQLQAVSEAFEGAVAQAIAAAQDPQAPLPPVPMWAAELRASRGLPPEDAVKTPKPQVAPEVRAKAIQLVQSALKKLDKEITQGHGKASAGAAGALRSVLKNNAKLIDDALESQVHAALGAAGELEGWQRWRADQLREELVRKAEDLFEPAAATSSSPVPLASAAPVAPTEADAGAPPADADTVSAAPDAVPGAAPVAAPVAARKPRLGGRKMQETLRSLRDQWKQTDQGGVPNHALWKRFDEACNEAYKVVEVWLDKVKADAAEHKAQRMALIEEVNAWAAANPVAKDNDWKGFSRIIHQFSERWRDAGHLGEKAFADIQPTWKAAIHAAALPLEVQQKASLARRHGLIDEARVLGEAAQLRIDAVKDLQARWQAEAHSVPLDRKQEQKLWDAFRKPIDEAFNRKSEGRKHVEAAMSAHDRVVLNASKALEEANASGDAAKIKAALTALDAALRAQALAPSEAPVQTPARSGPAGTDAAASADAQADAATASAVSDAGADAPQEAGEGADVVADAAEAAVAAAPKPVPKPVVAMRGDDRPGMKKPEAASLGRGGRDAGRKGGPGARGPRSGMDNKFEPYRAERGDRAPREDRGPRLGDAAFRAQREAVEHAQLALKKLAAHAHGEALTQMLGAWEQRSAEQVPSASDFGRAVPAAMRTLWVKAVSTAPEGDATEAILRLEMAAEMPTPAEHLDARRALQLKLLTRRNDPAPAQTWGDDAAKVLASAHEPQAARRLQNALKVLLRK